MPPVSASVPQPGPQRYGQSLCGGWLEAGNNALQTVSKCFRAKASSLGYVIIDIDVTIHVSFQILGVLRFHATTFTTFKNYQPFGDLTERACAATKLPGSENYSFIC
ncbi:MAG: hypothetical protein H6965_07420 [Chromatiaceae bacterium]|nr:hypothetical protein [Chromatiaceae bacterium]